MNAALRAAEYRYLTPPEPSAFEERLSEWMAACPVDLPTLTAQRVRDIVEDEYNTQRLEP